jgi:hypothetical protein
VSGIKYVVKFSEEGFHGFVVGTGLVDKFSETVDALFDLSKEKGTLQSDSSLMRMQLRMKKRYF